MPPTLVTMTDNKRALAAVLSFLISWIVGARLIDFPAYFVLAVLIGVLVWILTAPRKRDKGQGAPS